MKYLLTLAALLFIGCGDAQETPQAAAISSATEMVVNKSYTVYPGDHVDKTSAETKLKITKSIEGDTTTVILLDGSAELTRAQ